MSSIDVDQIPNFCAHEHWGSLFVFDPCDGGLPADMIRGLLPNQPVHLMHLIEECYFGGFTSCCGVDVNASAKLAGFTNIYQAAAKQPGKQMELLEPLLRRCRLMGVFQCTRLGIQRLYGVDIEHAMAENLVKLDEQIGVNYRHLFEWYAQAMKKLNFSQLIRPVHPEFYYKQHSAESASAEMAITNTILRIDPFCDMWAAKDSRRDWLAKQTGIDPVDAASWRAFLQAIMQQSLKYRNTGIKQLQAYTRELDFPAVSDASVRFRGELTEAEIRTFQNWMVNECCKLAADKGWPMQCHTGTHSHPNSNPLPLRNLAVRYPKMNVVMLHNWPYIDECGYLVQTTANMYIDTCWQPVLNPNYLQDSLHRWLNYVPTNKVMCSHDCTTVEMAAGSSTFTRGILSQELSVQASRFGYSPQQMRQVAADMLNNNAVRVYRIGSES